MELIDKILNLAADLDDFIEKRIGEEDIIQRYFSSPDPEIQDIINNLGNFLDDREVREENEAYRRMQEKELRKLIHMLRLGKVGEARKITFLYESELEY